MNGEEHIPSTDLETTPETPEVPEVPEGQEEAAALSLTEVQANVEALLYASGDPLSVKDLKKALPEAGDRIRPVLDQLKDLYSQAGRGLQLVEVAGGFQITTRPEFHEVVSRLLSSPKPARLSLQALETLAVIAYKQPVTAPEIAEIRGVNTAGVLATLIERRLIRIVGRKAVVGRPFMYATTREFLDRFGLNDIGDLPKIEDMAEVLGFEPPTGLAGAPEAPTPLPFDDEPEGEEEKANGAVGADQDPESPPPDETVH